jgi:hypothetical protein
MSLRQVVLTVLSSMLQGVLLHAMLLLLLLLLGCRGDNASAAYASKATRQVRSAFGDTILSEATSSRLHGLNRK